MSNIIIHIKKWQALFNQIWELILVARNENDLINSDKEVNRNSSYHKLKDFKVVSQSKKAGCTNSNSKVKREGYLVYSDFYSALQYPDVVFCGGKK